MRLLNARSFQVEEFFTSSNNKPQYAILSHTWGSEEVTLEDVRTEKARLKKGFAKLQYTCDQALKDGLEYAWIDTCCIDKTSSAELSEAINSMFEWYRRSSICYAYLEDVDAEDMLDSCIPEDHHMLPSEEQMFKDSHFARSRWFTRGWTLQELIAPSRVHFYGKNWLHLGSSSDLLDAIVLITGIDAIVISSNALDKREYIRRASIAQRMSWAAHRITTRVEDEAYCLMGIFEINMPALYGEGRAAFTRLQEEIIKSSSDQSILAWSVTADSEDMARYLLLAPDPSYFKACGAVIQWPRQTVQESFSMTNVGLSIRLPILKRNGDSDLAILSCRYAHNFRGPIAIALSDAGINGMRIQSYFVRRPTYTVGIEQAKLAIPSQVKLVILHRRPPADIIRQQESGDPPFPRQLHVASPTTFVIHENLIGLVTIETYYPSIHCRFASPGSRQTLLLPRALDFGALGLRYRGIALAVTFGKNKSWQPGDAWIAVCNNPNDLVFRDLVREGGRASNTKMDSRAWFQKYIEEFLEFFIVKKEIMEENVFEINGNIRKKTQSFTERAS
jgi:hypothetical protein